MSKIERSKPSSRFCRAVMSAKGGIVLFGMLVAELTMFFYLMVIMDEWLS